MIKRFSVNISNFEEAKDLLHYLLSITEEADKAGFSTSPESIAFILHQASKIANEALREEEKRSRSYIAEFVKKVMSDIKSLNANCVKEKGNWAIDGFEAAKSKMLDMINNHIQIDLSGGC